MEKKIINGLFLMLAGILVMTGCESTLDLPQSVVPKLTIISHLNPDNPEMQRVYVYASQSASDPNKFYTPEDLIVDITEVESKNTARLEALLEDGKKKFKIPSGFLKAGYNYNISAFAPGFDIVQATTEIPKPSTISDLLIQDVRINQSEAHEFKKIIHYKVTFNIDHFGSNQYYHLVFYNEYRGDPNLYLLNPEPSDNLPFLQHYEYGVLLDRSELPAGEPLAFDFKDWIVHDNDLLRIFVELRTITTEYYKYHSSLTRQLIVRQDPFAEPVTIFNNIEGGFGNFSGFSPNITSSDLPE